MNDDKPIDPDLLKRMMMGEFSSYSSPYKNVKPNQSKRNLELDLHFDKLYPTKSGLSSFEKLTLQLEAVDEFIQSESLNCLERAFATRSVLLFFLAEPDKIHTLISFF